MAYALREAINRLSIGERPPKLPVAPVEDVSASSRKQRKGNLRLINAGRFRQFEHIAEIVGRTAVTNRVVIAHASTYGNFTLYSLQSHGRHTPVDEDVVWRLGQDIELARARGIQRLEQIDALEEAEALGYISQAEANMVSRHINAWRAALRICISRGLYRNDCMEGLNPKAQQAETKSLTILAAYNAHYDTKVNKEIFAHAISFYHAHGPDFPPEFCENVHLDWFIMWYRDLLWNERHRSPDKEQTIDRVSPTTIVRHLEMSFSYVLQLQRRTPCVINGDNLEAARWTSWIAREDALPTVWNNDPVTPSPWEELRRESGLTEKEQEIGDDGYVLQVAMPEPTDFRHWKEWSSHFWPSNTPETYRPRLPTIRQPRIAILDIENTHKRRAIEQLRGYELKFQKWSKDVVAAVVWEDMQTAAMEGRTADMSRLYRHVREMMRGKAPGQLGQESDEEETDDDHSEEEDDSEDDEELTEDANELTV